MKKDAKVKGKEIMGILDEMKSSKLKKLGFTDLLIETCIKSKYGEKFERYGSTDGFKTVIEDVIEKTGFSTHRERMNNVSVEDSYIKDNMLTVVYEKNKKATFNLNTVVKVFIMKKNDSKIY